MSRLSTVGFLFIAAAALPIASAARTSLTWTPTGPTNGDVFSHVASLLQNGKLLIAGGRGPTVLASAQLYDPASGRWSFTGSMSTPRQTHTGTLLPDGHVLVTGGQSGVILLDSAEFYDPATGQWSLTGSMSTVRVAHAAVLLNTGEVLVARGNRTRPGHHLSDHHRTLRSDDWDVDADRQPPHWTLTILRSRS